MIDQLQCNFWVTIATMRLRTASLTFFIICTFLAGFAVTQGPRGGISPGELEGCPGPTPADVLICYLSAACRGGLALRDSGDGVTPPSSVEECCSGLGLSYCDQRGCRDCFSTCDTVCVCQLCVLVVCAVLVR